MDCTQICIVLLLKQQIRYVMHLFLHGSVYNCEYKTTLTLLLLVSLLLSWRQKQVMKISATQDTKYTILCQISEIKQQEIEQLWEKLWYV